METTFYNPPPVYQEWPYALRNHRPKYVIVSKTREDFDGSPLYFSRQYGWTNLEQADIYTGAERAGCGCPRDGEWQEKFSMNNIPRRQMAQAAEG